MLYLNIQISEQDVVLSTFQGDEISHFYMLGVLATQYNPGTRLSNNKFCPIYSFNREQWGDLITTLISHRALFVFETNGGVMHYQNYWGKTVNVLMTETKKLYFPYDVFPFSDGVENSVVEMYKKKIRSETEFFRYIPQNLHNQLPV